MDIAINHLAVVLAALSAMAVGSIWYSPRGFYKTWAHLARVKQNTDMRSGRMAFMFGSVFLASWLMSYVLAVSAVVANHFFQNSFIQDTLAVAFWAWLGFVVTRFYVHDTFENRPWRLTALNTAHEGITLLVMAIIIGSMGY